MVTSNTFPDHKKRFIKSLLEKLSPSSYLLNRVFFLSLKDAIYSHSTQYTALELTDGIPGTETCADDGCK
jgi:hypothetical protein